MNTYITIAFYVLLAIAIIIASPFIFIWSLNTLFPALAIPTNIWTYLAAIWVQSLLVLSVKKS